MLATPPHAKSWQSFHEAVGGRVALCYYFIGDVMHTADRIGTTDAPALLVIEHSPETKVG